MEFKGTKGEWIVSVSNEYTGDYSIKTKNGAATSFEDEANALLISKSPEMLEMLQYLSEKLGTSFEREKQEINQLIKQATEL